MTYQEWCSFLLENSPHIDRTESNFNTHPHVCFSEAEGWTVSREECKSDKTKQEDAGTQ